MITPEDVRSALDQIVGSEGFNKAPRLCRFITFAVEKELAGAGGELKEYLLGTEVFDRGTNFDPRLDPIVRVEARRLRAKVQEYYEGAGKDSAIRIVFTKGNYAPRFVASEEEAAALEPEAALVSKPEPRRWLWPALGCILLMAASAFAFRALIFKPTSSILVMPFTNSGDPKFTDGVAESVATELARNRKLHVVAWPLFVEYRRKKPDADNIAIKDAAKELGAELVLLVSIRNQAGRCVISAMVMNPNQGWKKWAGEYECNRVNGFAEQKAVAESIATSVRNISGTGIK